MEHFTITMKETEIVGYVLRLIHNLQHLHLVIVNGQGRDPQDSMAYSSTSIRHVFGKAKDGKSELEDLSRINGLIKLQSLTLSCGILERAWFSLKNLNKLSVSHHVRFFDDKLSVGDKFQLKVLKVERTTDILKPDRVHPKCKSISYFLSHFSLLEKLVVSLCNGKKFDPSYAMFSPILSSWVWGNFDTLLANIHPVAPTLQHLIVLECDYDYVPVSSFLNYVTPFTTLVHFKDLRILEVHHKALICLDGRPRAPVEALLLASLEVLKIHTPQLIILELLEEIPPLRPHFANLTTIELWPRNHHGGDYEAFHYRCHGVWYHLDAVGIEVAIFWHMDDYNRNWEDEQYDPFVCEIVEFLKWMPGGPENGARRLEVEDRGYEDMEDCCGCFS